MIRESGGNVGRLLIKGGDTSDKLDFLVFYHRPISAQCQKQGFLWRDADLTRILGLILSQGLVCLQIRRCWTFVLSAHWINKTLEVCPAFLGTTTEGEHRFLAKVVAIGASSEKVQEPRVTASDNVCPANERNGRRPSAASKWFNQLFMLIL